jgi:uncharacterized protein YndB with AHSA1/START domain
MNDFSVTLELPHPPATLFRFLADPTNRPLWQGSLRGVTNVDRDEPQLGMQWRDVTKVGIKPWMEITELTPYRVLSETGTWRGVDGLLTLRFVKTQQGTRVTAEGRLIGHGPFALAAAVSGRWAPETIRKDLLRASEILGARDRTSPDVGPKEP